MRKLKRDVEVCCRQSEQRTSRSAACCAFRQRAGRERLQSAAAAAARRRCEGCLADAAGRPPVCARCSHATLREASRARASPAPPLAIVRSHPWARRSAVQGPAGWLVHRLRCGPASPPPSMVLDAARGGAVLEPSRKGPAPFHPLRPRCEPDVCERHIRRPSPASLLLSAPHTSQHSALD